VRELPRGTVTFLFTDIEGSTRLLHELGNVYADVLAEHRRVLREAFGRHGGVEVDTQGDAFFYAFGRAADAVAAAADAQAALADGPVRVRIGMHTGEPLLTDEGYVGVDVHRAARVMSAGHGGQVLVTERTRAQLDREAVLTDLGLHRLKDLGRPEKLFQLGDGEFPPLKTLDATNLPVAATPLLGRERELAELVPLLQNGTRLLTITGPGGTGKTRLALQIAAELVGAFADGVFWVPLAALDDPELVLPTVGETIGARGDLGEHLRGKQVLLLLDNAEHLLAAAPGLAELLTIEPKLRILVTSRAPLHVSAEREFQLDPLPTTDAVTLFVERARAAGRQFAADVTVEAICRRLDGLPLAIELAAARTKLLDAETLLARLEQTLPLLTGGPRDAPERQRTLRSTIEWSYDLLEDDAKRLFASLSVFRGSLSLAAAEEVCEADVETLSTLVDSSLLKPIGESRFLMLETIREYAGTRLNASELEAFSDRHAEFFLSIVGDAKGAIKGPNARAVFDRLATDISNIRAALGHVAKREPERALRAAVALTPYWWVRAPLEGRHVVADLYRADVQPNLRADALEALGVFAWMADDVAEAQRCAEGRLEITWTLGDDAAVATAMAQLGMLARQGGDPDRAAELGDEALAIARALDDRVLIGRLLIWRAEAETDFGEVDRALALFEEAAAVFADAGDGWRLGVAKQGIGVTRCRRGEWELALAPLLESLSACQEAGDTKEIAVSLDHLAAVSAATGAPARAARLFGSGEAAWSSIGIPLKDAYRPPYVQDALAAARATLGADAFETERAAGAALTLDDAVREARSID
jgi:predicted ATPase/class 3 adenylate cyclase